MKSYIDWIKEDGFHAREIWDDENKRMGGAGLLKLFPLQERILGYALQFNEDGLLKYETVLFSCTKKSGKTAIAASVGCWYAEVGKAGTEIYVIANTLESGAGRTFRDIQYQFQQRQRQYGRRY